MKKSIFSLLLIVGISANLVASDRFVRDDTKEVVIDRATNLMWQDNNDTITAKKDWLVAIGYCENLTLGGYSDWHLPNNNELFGLADKSRVHPAIDPVFKNVISGEYFSSSIYCSNEEDYDALYVSFNNGDVDNCYMGLSRYVRCVRDND